MSRGAFSFVSVVLPVGGGARRVTLSGYWLAQLRYVWVDERATQAVLLGRLEEALLQAGGVPAKLALRRAGPLSRGSKGRWFPAVLEFCRHYGSRVEQLQHDEDRWLVEERDELRALRHSNLKSIQYTLERRCREDGVPPGLLPLPTRPRVSQREVFRRVAADGFVHFEHDSYSVPTSYIGKTVWVRRQGSDRVVIRSQAGRVLADHKAGTGRDEARLDLAHFDFRRTTAPELRFLKRLFLRQFPEDGPFYSHVVAQRKKSAPLTLRWVLQLAQTLPSSELREAFRSCFEHNNFSHRFLKGLLERKRTPKPEPTVTRPQQGILFD